jgi:zinc and cadmium transporter
VHNFIDGIAIAAGFLVDPPTGIIVTLAVAAHEIPQEIGDFGLLLSHGVKRGRVLLINVLSALATTVAAVSFYLLGQSFDVTPYLPYVLAVVAGFFIYIALSDIIPTIHRVAKRRLVLLQSLVLLLGIAIASVVIHLLHGFIE